MTDHPNCREYFERLSELLDGELDQAASERIMAHIQGCPHCCACWATFKKSVEIFQSLGPEPIPPETLRRLKDHVAGLKADLET